MFQTTIGPYSGAVGYGRPEAAQNIFVEFNRLYTTARERLPFGCIQIGHALRNEISPRQGLIRLREFTIADLEFFFDPEEPCCDKLEEVENEVLPILLCETRLKECEDITNFTVREALDKKIIRSEWQAFFMAMAKRLSLNLVYLRTSNASLKNSHGKKPITAAKALIKKCSLTVGAGWKFLGMLTAQTIDLTCHMKASGVDMTVYKEYATPVEKEELTVKPIMAKLGPVYKGDAGKVAAALAKVPAQEVADAMKKDGSYMAGNYQVLPEQVDISKQKTIVRGNTFRTPRRGTQLWLRQALLCGA